jgi:hypothetical protein
MEFEQARARKDEKRALKKLWDKLGDISFLDPAFMRSINVSRDTRNLLTYWAIAS